MTRTQFEHAVRAAGAVLSQRLAGVSDLSERQRELVTRRIGADWQTTSGRGGSRS